MDCHVFGFIALDEILWHFPRSVMHVPFDFRVGNDLLDDDSADPASLGIPSHVITDLECFRHRGHPISHWFNELIKAISTSCRVSFASNIHLFPKRTKGTFQ